MTMQTWVEGAAGSGFDVDHLPYGVFARSGEHPRVAVRIGDFVLDLSIVAAADMVDTHALFDQPTLNPFMAAGPAVWDSTRAWVTGLLTDETERDLVEPALSPVDSVRMLMPFTVGDYVDFYASEHHASNVGRMFRPDAEPLLPNWKHLPVGYHGRSGTVVVSGTDVVRPSGQRKAPSDDAADLRSVAAPRHRGRARLRRRRALGDGRPGQHGRLRPSHLRRRRAQRLVGTRHPGLGVRPARPVPREVLRHLDQRLGDAARRPGRGVDGPPRAGRPRGAGLPRGRRTGRPRHRGGGGARRRGRRAAAVPHHVLVARADAGPHHGQRRERPHRRPVGVGHGLRDGAGPARLAAGAELGRPGAVHRRRSRARPSSRTATRSCCATPHPAPAADGSRWARCPDGSSPPAERGPRLAP